MAHFVGLDVSVKATSVCVVDDGGKVDQPRSRLILEQKVPTEPAEIIAVLTSLAVAGQCVDGGRPASDLRGDAAHEGLADGAANQQDGP